MPPPPPGLCVYLNPNSTYERKPATSVILSCHLPSLVPPPPPFRSLLIPHRPPSIIMSFICTCTFYNERKWDIPDPMSPKSDTHYVPESDTHTDLGVACCDVLSLETGVLLNSVGKIVQHIFFSWILTLGLLFCSWRPGRFRVWQAASH